jgi:hypothetical protein
VGKISKTAISMKNNVFVYHWKNDDFIGDVLCPLNELKKLSLDTYNRAIKKYEGREWLLEPV